MIRRVRSLAFALTLVVVTSEVAMGESIDVPAGTGFTAIAGGGYHSLALRKDGSIVGWGWNDYGQSAIPPGRFIAIAAGQWHSTAVRADGTLAAWGRNHRQQLEIPSDGGYVAVAAGRHHNIALRIDGSIVGWGDDEFGRASPPAGDGFIALACGMRHSVALHADGSLLVWGDNGLGQLDAPQGNDFVAIAAGGYRSVALRKDGSAVAWGRLPKKGEVIPSGELTAVDLGSFDRYFAIVLRRDGTLAACGEALYGQTDVPAGNDYIALAAGAYHGLALRKDGSLVGWGREAPGQMRVTVTGEKLGTIPEWRKEPPETAVQTVYRGGVPHTDRQGRLRMKYDPEKSFFPIGIYGYADDSDWESLGRAHYNTITHGIRTPDNFPELLERYDLAVIWTGRGDAEEFGKRVEHYKTKTWRHRLLAQYCIDEPYVFTGSSGYTSDDPIDVIQSGWRDVYRTTKEGAQHHFPDLPVYVNLSPQVDAPQNGWGEWIRTSDIACLDDYPFYDRDGVRHGHCRGIARSIRAAVLAGDEKKPTWYVGQTFEHVLPDRDRYHRFPRPEELRGSVYAAVVHGATGIIYWVWDHPGWRTGRVIGMSENPPIRKNSLAPATPMHRIQSQALWAAAAQVNRELTELTPILLSPTVGPEVKYSLGIIKGQPKTKADIHSLLKPHPDGGYVLLTVNLDTSVLIARIEFASALASAERLFEDRNPASLSEDTRSFDEHYKPFEVHVYRVQLAK